MDTHISGIVTITFELSFRENRGKMNDHRGPVTSSDAMAQVVNALLGKLVLVIGRKVGSTAKTVAHKASTLKSSRKNRSTK